MKNKISIFISKYGLLFGGISIFAVSLIVIRNGFLEKDLIEENRIVNVQILELLESRSNYYLKLQYDNQSFVERIDADNFRRIKGKNEVRMLTNKENNKFIFSNSFKQNNNFLYGSLLGLIGLIIIYKGRKVGDQKR